MIFAIFKFIVEAERECLLPLSCSNYIFPCHVSQGTVQVLHILVHQSIFWPFRKTYSDNCYFELIAYWINYVEPENFQDLFLFLWSVKFIRGNTKALSTQRSSSWSGGAHQHLVWHLVLLLLMVTHVCRTSSLPEAVLLLCVGISHLQRSGHSGLDDSVLTRLSLHCRMFINVSDPYPVGTSDSPSSCDNSWCPLDTVALPHVLGTRIDKILPSPPLSHWEPQFYVN